MKLFLRCYIEELLINQMIEPDELNAIKTRMLEVGDKHIINESGLEYALGRELADEFTKAYDLSHPSHHIVLDDDFEDDCLWA